MAKLLFKSDFPFFPHALPREDMREREHFLGHQGSDINRRVFLH
jgi:hypothetical protein